MFKKPNLLIAFVLNQELEAENVVLTNGMYAYLIDAYVENKKTNEALQLFEEIRAKSPDFSLHPVKLLRLVLRLVEDDQIESKCSVIWTLKRLVV